MADKSNSPEAELARLRGRIKRLRKKLAQAQDAPKALGISPLAPEKFPQLPVIQGVRFAAGSAEVKYKNRDDVSLVEIAQGSSVAGTFTTSLTRSSAVLDCETKLANIQNGQTTGPVGLVVNSGNANAFTGKSGDGSVEAISNATAEILKTNVGHIFTSSTGVIGEPLPHERIVTTLEKLSGELSENNAEASARAIMTTDTFAKGSAAEFILDGRTVKIAGYAKGSGMVAPDMATMLVYIFTDAAITPAALQKIVSANTIKSFNSITVDGDTSTSDTLLVFATGAAGNPEIKSTTSKAAKIFKAELYKVMLDLAQQVVRDGEGATKFIEINVTGAASDSAAHTVGLSIANSPLVKTAFAGEDPNWGRVVMAVGKSGEKADRDSLTIRFGDILVAEKGWVAHSYREEDGVAYMKADTLSLSVDLGVGTGSAQVWTCDLTHGYIQINADYRS
jgi:glutamate N-acetyltransferase/amino-acid N-acetyltransferase